jgi:hypothetical protein
VSAGEVEAQVGCLAELTSHPNFSSNQLWFSILIMPVRRVAPE